MLLHEPVVSSHKNYRYLNMTRVDIWLTIRWSCAALSWTRLVASRTNVSWIIFQTIPAGDFPLLETSTCATSPSSHFPPTMTLVLTLSILDWSFVFAFGWIFCRSIGACDISYAVTDAASTRALLWRISRFYKIFSFQIQWICSPSAMLRWCYSRENPIKMSKILQILNSVTLTSNDPSVVLIVTRQSILAHFSCLVILGNGNLRTKLVIYSCSIANWIGIIGRFGIQTHAYGLLDSNTGSAVRRALHWRGEQSKRWRLSEFAINKLLDFFLFLYFLSKRTNRICVWIAYRLPAGSPSKVTARFDFVRHQIKWTLIASSATVILTNNLTFSFTFVSTLIGWEREREEGKK